MDVFDIDTKKWSQTPSFYGPFYDVGVTVINRWIVVTGEISAIVGPGGKRQMRP